MKKLCCLCVVLLAMVAGSNVYAQCWRGSCCQSCRPTTIYKPYSYKENCSRCNSCQTETCSAGTCSVETQQDESQKDQAEFKTMELHKTEEVSEEYKPESDGLLYAKCVKCGASLGFRVQESDKHSCPHCHAWYRYFENKLWYEVKTEKRIVKIPCSKTSAVGSIQINLFNEINKARTERGLKPYVYDKNIEVGAQSHSVNMSRRFSCDHNDPINGCAEICASWQTSPLAAVTAWLNSVGDWRHTGHRQLLLGNYTKCGVGVATDCYGRKYWTARFK